MTQKLIHQIAAAAAARGLRLSTAATLSGACIALGLARTAPRPAEAEPMLRAWLTTNTQAAPTDNATPTDTYTLRQMRKRLRRDFTPAQAQAHGWKKPSFKPKTHPASPSQEGQDWP